MINTKINPRTRIRGIRIFDRRLGAGFPEGTGNFGAGMATIVSGGEGGGPDGSSGLADGSSGITNVGDSAGSSGLADSSSGIASGGDSAGSSG